MKKSKLFVFCLALLLPVIFLTGCGPTAKFSITTKTSNINLGNASGGSTSPYLEGSEISLSATPKSGENFLCWIKDYKQVVSIKQTVNIKVSEKTAGNYTALFQEKNISSMVYAGLSEISYEGEDISKFEYSIRYAPADNTEQFTTLTSGTSETNKVEGFSGNVINLFENSQHLAYIFETTLTVTSHNGNSSTTLTIRNAGTDMKIDRTNFDNEGNAVISKSGLTLKLTKLNQEMVQALAN